MEYDIDNGTLLIIGVQRIFMLHGQEGKIYNAFDNLTRKVKKKNQFSDHVELFHPPYLGVRIWSIP